MKESGKIKEIKNKIKKERERDNRNKSNEGTDE
jgi:hypothetical protein